MPSSSTSGLQDRDFPGSPVVKTLHFQCRVCRFDPWSGKQDTTYGTSWQGGRGFWWQITEISTAAWNRRVQDGSGLQSCGSQGSALSTRIHSLHLSLLPRVVTSVKAGFLRMAVTPGKNEFPSFLHARDRSASP